MKYHEALKILDHQMSRRRFGARGVTGFAFLCPYCDMMFYIDDMQMNCGIFRHGSYVASLQSIEPHLSEAQCIKLVQENKIIGCGKPLACIRTSPTEAYVEICPYL